MTKDKKGTWGGKRPNQTGRPTLGDSPRVQLHAMIDPATKENLGPVEIPIGMVRIVQVKPKTSTAIPVGELMIPPKPGDIVRH